MTLAKVTITGRVTKSPEKRFTQNDVALTSFVIAYTDPFSQEETLVRVMAWGNLAGRVADTTKEGDFVLVDGRLQTAGVKLPNGKERRIFEINAASIDKIIPADNFQGAAFRQTEQVSAPAMPAAAQSVPKSSDIVQFAVDEISEDLIDEDEIPF